jgi:ABC-type lipoprotein export system ATPase subunit
MTESIISLRGIKKFYGSGAGRQQVLHDVDLEVERSALVSIVGTSGSGKSTLLNIIGGLDRDFTGAVTVAGHQYARLSDSRLSDVRNTSIGFVFQSFNLLDHLTCWENVALPAYFDSQSTADARKRAAEVLARVGLEEKIEAKPGNLSGGQKQRVAIARAVFNKPKILLCDEPTGNLDSETGRQIIELFRSLNTNEGITLVLVTHEHRVSRVAHRVIRLEDGRIVDVRHQEPSAPPAASSQAEKIEPEEEHEAGGGLEPPGADEPADEEAKGEGGGAEEDVRSEKEQQEAKE